MYVLAKQLWENDMQILTDGQKAELVERPIFNWCLMGAFGLLGFAGFIALLVTLPGMTEVKRGIMEPVMYGTLLTALVGVAGMLLTPTRIHTLDLLGGTVSVRNRYLVGADSEPELLADLSQVESEFVGGPGPEAYWIHLVYQNGKREKLRPAAFQPHLEEQVMLLFRQTLAGASRMAAPGNTIRQQFGQA